MKESRWYWFHLFPISIAATAWRTKMVMSFLIRSSLARCKSFQHELMNSIRTNPLLPSNFFWSSVKAITERWRADHQEDRALGLALPIHIGALLAGCQGNFLTEGFPPHMIASCPIEFPTVLRELPRYGIGLLIQLVVIINSRISIHTREAQGHRLVL